MWPITCGLRSSVVRAAAAAAAAGYHQRSLHTSVGRIRTDRDGEFLNVSGDWLVSGVDQQRASVGRSAAVTEPLTGDSRPSSIGQSARPSTARVYKPNGCDVCNLRPPSSLYRFLMNLCRNESYLHSRPNKYTSDGKTRTLADSQ